MQDPARLRSIHTMTLMVKGKKEKIDVPNELAYSGLVVAVIGEEMAQDREKRVAATLAAAPKSLRDVLREELLRQLSAGGRFQVVAADGDAIAVAELSFLQLVQPPFESRERLALDITFTMWDRNEQPIWYGATGKYNDDRVPLLDSSVYEEDPIAAFEAYSAAIRIGVSDLIRRLEGAPAD